MNSLEISVEHDFLYALGVKGVDFRAVYSEGVLLIIFHIGDGLFEVFIQRVYKC